MRSPPSISYIKKSEDSGTTYEDTEFKELSQFLKTLIEVLKLVVDELRRELGAMAEEVLERAKEGLGEDYSRIFHGISHDFDVATDTNKILKNISVNYPSPADRLMFIKGFHELINNVLQEIRQILGIPLTKKVIAEIGKVRGEVSKFCADSPAKGKVLDALDTLVAQFSG
jgi:hypothetical protein